MRAGQRPRLVIGYCNRPIERPHMMSRGGAYRSEARVLHERLAIECLALAKAETVRHLFNVSLSPVTRLATYH